MLEKLFKPFTTSSATGVTVRDITAYIGAIIAVLGILGWLSPEQIDALKAQVDTLTDPKILTAIGLLLSSVVSVYRIFFKSSSDKAAGAAKAIDKEVAPDATVVIKTPDGQPDIVVPGR